MALALAGLFLVCLAGYCSLPVYFLQNVSNGGVLELYQYMVETETKSELSECYWRMLKTNRKHIFNKILIDLQVKQA